MEDVVISPCREKGEPALEGCGLLLINPSAAVAAVRLARELGGREHFLFNSRLVQVAAGPDTAPFFVAGPAVGAPMAVLTLEKLVALGCGKLIVYGWCGSLSPTLAAGDILLPTFGVSDEGTSPHYPLKRQAVSSASIRKMLVGSLAQQSMSVQEGAVWTTDAPYRETWARARAMAVKGILAVEMEFAALATVASFRAMEMAAVLLVSDELWGERWRPVYRQKGFKKTSRELLKALIDCCRNFPASSTK